MDSQINTGLVFKREKLTRKLRKMNSLGGQQMDSAFSHSSGDSTSFPAGLGD